MNPEDVATAARDVAAKREALTTALEQRDAAIRRAFAEGWPIGALAEVTGLTRARIASILGHPFQRVGRPSAPAARSATKDH
jgi:hypothetical protein